MISHKSIIKRNTDPYGNDFFDFFFSKAKQNKKTIGAVDSDIGFINSIIGEDGIEAQIEKYKEIKDQLSSYGKEALGDLNVANFGEKFESNSKQAIASLEETKKAAQGVGTVTGEMPKGFKGFMTTLGGTLMNMGITLAISAVIEGIKMIANAESDAIEKSKDLQDQWAAANKELTDNKQTVDDYGERYAELSKGVDTTTNQNISLSTDEYKEYLDITNRIGDQFGNLISGYDAENNAILRIQGSLSALNDEYERLAQQNRDAVITDAADVLQGAYYELKGKENVFAGLFGGDNSSAADKANIIETIIGTISSGGDVGKALKDNFNAKDVYDNLGEDFRDLFVTEVNIPGTLFSTYGWKDISKNIGEIEGLLPQLQAQLNLTQSGVSSALGGYQSVATAMLGNHFARGGSLAGVSEANAALINQLPYLMDADFWVSMGDDSDEIQAGIQEWVNQQAEALSSPEAQASLDAMREARQAYEANEMTYREMADIITGEQVALQNLGADGFTFARNQLPDDMKTKVTKADAVLTDVDEAGAWQLTKAQYEFLAALDNGTEMTYGEMLATMAEQAAIAAVAVDTLTDSYTKYAEARDTANDVSEKSLEQGYLTAAQYKELYDANAKYADAVYEDTDGVYHVDPTKLANVNKQILEDGIKTSMEGLENARKELAAAADDATIAALNSEIKQREVLLAQQQYELEELAKQSNLNAQIASQDFAKYKTKRTSAIDIAKAANEQGYLSPEQYDELIAADKRYQTAIRTNAAGMLTVDYEEIQKVNDALAAEGLKKALEDKRKALEEYNAAMKIYEGMLESGLTLEDAAVQAQADLVNGFADQANAAELAANGYRNATSALQRFLDAVNSPEEGDAMRSAKAAVDEIKKGLESGRTNTNAYKEAAKYWFGEESLGWTDKQMQARLKPIEKLYDKDGELDNNQFLDYAYRQGALDRTRNQDGTYHYDAGGRSIDEMANLVGISAEALKNALSASNEYGSDFQVSGSELVSGINKDDTSKTEQAKDVTMNADGVTINANSINVDGAKIEGEESSSDGGSGSDGGKSETSSAESGESSVTLSAEVTTEAAMAAVGEVNSAIQEPATKPVNLEATEAMGQANQLHSILGAPVTKVVRLKVIGDGSGDGSGDGGGGGSGGGLNSNLMVSMVDGGEARASGSTLVGEIAPEIIVNRKTGTWRLVETPQLTNLNKGDIVFNGNQTRKILSGQETTYGEAMASGNARRQAIKLAAARRKARDIRNELGKNPSDKRGSILGLVASVVTGGGDDTKPRRSGGGSGGGSGSGETVDPWEAALKQINKLWDWVARALEVAKEATDKLIKEAAKKVGYIAKNMALEEAVDSTRKQIELNQQGYEKYMETAGKVQKKMKLSDDIVAKIQNGTIDVSSYNENMQKRIQAYQKWWELAEGCLDTIEELKEQERELQLTRLDNIIDYYDMRVERMEAQIDKSAAEREYKIALGVEIDEADFVDGLNAAQQKVMDLEAARAAYQAEFDSLMASGVIEYDSDDWHEYIANLEDLDEQILETKVDVIELNDEINNIKLTNLRYALDTLNAIQSSIEGFQGFHAAQGVDEQAQSYVDLIKNGFEQIKNLEQQNEYLRDQQAGLDVLSEKYQEIQEQIDGNNDSIWDIKASQEGWNDEVANLRIIQLQKQREELEKANDAYQRQLSMEEALRDLDKAKNKRVLVYREDVGYQYEVDQDAVREAQERLDEVLHQETISKIDDAIAAIEDLAETDNIYDFAGEQIIKDVADMERNAQLFDATQSTLDIESLLKEAMNNQLGSTLADILKSNQALTLTIGDINLEGVQDVDGLAQAIVQTLPNQVYQELYKR